MARTWAGSWADSWADSWGNAVASTHPSWACSWSRAWLDSWGDTSSCVIAPSGGVGGGTYLEWWEREWARIREERAKRKAKRVPKKKRTLLDELDEAILELRSRIRDGEVPREAKIEVRKIQRFSDSALEAAVTADQVKLYVSLAEALLREMDDEEAIILLALH